MTAFSMLEFYTGENSWEPPVTDGIDVFDALKKHQYKRPYGEYLFFICIEPYIDFLFVKCQEDSLPDYSLRFTLHEGYIWGREYEQIFYDHCIKSDNCIYSTEDLDEIYEIYHSAHPEWHLQRYYTKGLRVLDHIYHCMKKNTAKEMLYKSGLDYLAVYIDEIDELNLLAKKPSDLYDGLSMRVLRSMNCRDGAELLRLGSNRHFLKDLNMKFPNIFQEKLNDAHCRYLKYLIDGELTIGETGRLFSSRKKRLISVWCKSQFDLFMQRERFNKEMEEECKIIQAIDPLYIDYLKNINDYAGDPTVKQLSFFLVHNRETYDKKIRRSNRKRDYDWMERGNGYFVRYPWSINDFCREAIYMSNCLLSYVDSVIENDTTILFMRKEDDVNAPFITIEIYHGELMQAYHRFNEDCTPEEAAWIRAYCKRHGIYTDKFKFDAAVDQLF